MPGRPHERNAPSARQLEDALALFDVPVERPEARRSRIPLVGVFVGLLLTLVGAVFGASVAGDLAPDPSPAPANANHCVDSMGPYNSHGCAGTTLTSPANAATGVSTTPSLQIGTTDGAFSGSLNSTITLCSNSACSAVVQTSPTLNSTGGSASWTPSALTSGTTYWWKAATCDFYGNCGDPTAIWSFTVGAGGNTAPNAPSSLAQYKSDGTTAIATAAWTNQSTVVFKFNVSDPNASQTLTPWVEVSTTGSFSGTCGTAGANMFSGTNVTATTGGTNYLATVTATGLSDGSTYYWRACSKDQGGLVSSWTARAGAPDFRIDTTAPTNPTSAEIFDLSTSFSLDRDATTSTTALSMSWNAASDAGSGVLNYDACFSTVNSGCTAIAGTAMVSANTTRTATATATGMSNGVTYYTCVRSRDNQNWVTGWICSDGFTVNLAGAVPTITLVAPAANAWVTDDTPSVQARYDDPEATNGQVRIEFCATNAASPWSVNCASGYRAMQTAVDGAVSGTPVSLAPNTAIAQGANFWRAMSVDAQGLSSAWTAGRQINVDSVAPAPIPSVTLVRRGRGRIDVTYTTSTDALNPPVTYDVEAFDNTGGTWQALCAATTSTTCIKTGLGGQELFVTRVRACDALGNCTAWAVQGAVANSGYLLRNLTSAKLNNTQSRQAILGAGGTQDATTTGISLPATAGQRVGSFPFRYNTTVSAPVTLDTSAPVDPQNTTSGWGWVVDAVATKSLSAGNIELEAVTIPAAGATGNGVGKIRCRAWKVTTNGTTAMTSWSYIGEAYGDVNDVMTAAGSGTTSSTCTIASPTQLTFGANDVLYVEPILEATSAGASGDAYKLVFNDASSSINIPQPGTAPGLAVLQSPANLAITSATPTLSAQYVHGAGTDGRIEIQYSQDSSFATGVTMTSTTKLSAGSVGSIVTDTLPQGSVWYWRARGVDTADLVGSWTTSRSFTVSTQPAEPVPSAPANGVTQTPGAKTFTAGAFSDPNGGSDSHTASEWQVIPLGGSWASPIATSGVTGTSLTSWLSPALPEGQYEWRVRYRDNFGMWSNWSGTTPANARTLTLSNGTLTLSAGSTNLNMGIQNPGIDGFISTTITAVATGPTGYTLNANDDSDTLAAYCSCGTNVSDWTGTNASPTVWAAGTPGYFGLTVRDATGGRLAKWGTGTGTSQTDVANNKYVGLRAGSSVLLHSKASATTAGGDIITATWRLDPSVSMLAGSYSTTTLFTLVANP